MVTGTASAGLSVGAWCIMGKKVVCKSVQTSRKRRTMETKRRDWLLKSGGKLPTSPTSASKGFSSTPIKCSRGEENLHISNGMDDGVLSEDDDTFSLLSPIYHESFDSDEDSEPSPAQQTSPHRQRSTSALSVSPVRCELPRTHSDQMLSAAVKPAASPTLSAWEMWLVNKAKEDRLKLERKSEEERLLKEKKEQEETEKEHKRKVMDEKIHEWLKTKRQQEKQEQLLKLSKEEVEMQRKQEKQTEIEQKAQQKYKDWLQKKNQEKVEKEKKDKEEATLKAEQERERRKRAEEMFKDWLAKANEKSRASPKSPCYPKSPYDKSCPPPSFFNPIPWKPIPVPPPETLQNKTTDKKPQKQRKCQQSSSNAFRLRNTVSTAQPLQRR